MSAPFLYHSVEPENSKATYTEYDNVDFVMNFEGRKLVCNTVRLEGLLRVSTQGVNLPLDGAGAITTKIFIDPSIGIHSVVDSIQTSVLSLGSVENFNGYARYVGMTEDTTTNNNDMCNSENLSELKFPMLQIMPVLHGEVARNNANLNNPNSFSFKPQFILNTASEVNGQGLGMSFNKTGTIRVVFSLARINDVLFGPDVDNTTTYQLENLRLVFTSIPEDGVKNNTVHKVKYHIKQSILSRTTNISSNIPAKCSGVSCSFITQAKENTTGDNSYNRETYPDLQELQFLFNNNTNEYITYQIRDNDEVLLRYLLSMGKTSKHNRTQLTELSGKHSYGVGLDFQGMIDLSTQTFNVVLNSNSDIQPMSIHLYFHSMVEV